MASMVEVPSLEYILKNTRVVARHCSGYRFVGSFDEVDAHCKLYDESEDEENDYIKDSDIVCCEGQPDDLRWFYSKYESYCRKYGWSTIQDFYKELMKYARR